MKWLTGVVVFPMLATANTGQACSSKYLNLDSVLRHYSIQM